MCYMYGDRCVDCGKHCIVYDMFTADWLIDTHTINFQELRPKIQ